MQILQIKNILPDLPFTIFLVGLLVIPFYSFSQEEKPLDFHGREYFLLEGTLIENSLKENPYHRLPASYKDKVREPVWELSKRSAGLSIRFITNSTSIHVKWSLINDTHMNHMAETGIKGIDLYYKIEGDWQYINTARPQGKENEYELISNMPLKPREFRMYLPLYDGIENLEVGIDRGSNIKKPKKNNRPSIMFYGTSITQGGCASRPGMAHTNIISRRMNVNVVNLGFSGNGRMEQPIAELMAGFDPLFYVIECLPNMTAEQVFERTIPLVETIRAKRPETPVVLVENFIYSQTALDTVMANIVQKKNEALWEQYKTMISQGEKNLYYIHTEEALGKDREATVDGIHFTDVGFLRYAGYLIDHFIRWELIENR